QNLVQRIDFTLNAAAAFQIDDRIAHGRKDGTRGNHVRIAEPDHSIAVSVCRRGMEQLNALTIEEGAQLVRFLQISLRWLGIEWSFGLSHSFEEILVAEKRCADIGVCNRAGNVSASEALARQA